MATKTVYLPITIETKSEISDEQAKNLVNQMKYMLDDDFYNRDNMFDDATEFDIPLRDISIGKTKSFTDLTQVQLWE
jgi:hypothetical protein